MHSQKIYYIITWLKKYLFVFIVIPHTYIFFLYCFGTFLSIFFHNLKPPPHPFFHNHYPPTLFNVHSIDSPLTSLCYIVVIKKEKYLQVFNLMFVLLWSFYTMVIVGQNIIDIFFQIFSFLYLIKMFIACKINPKKNLHLTLYKIKLGNLKYLFDTNKDKIRLLNFWAIFLK